MLALALIGLAGGLITGISPCILPVLPVILFSGGAQSARTGSVASTGTGGDATRPPSRWRPYLVIAGLVVSFSLVTLVVQGSARHTTLARPVTFQHGSRMKLPRKQRYR